MRRLFRLTPNARRAVAELDEELAFHLEERAAELRRRGAGEAEARAEALRRLGDVQELRDYCGVLARRRARRHRVGEWWGEWMRDVHFAARQLRRAPGFVTVALVSLALGIGANTAIFSTVDHLLIAPVPYPDADRVVIVDQTTSSIASPFQMPQDIADTVVARTRAFASVGTYVWTSFTLDEPDGPERLDGALMGADVLRTVGMKPILGRGFAPDDTLPGAPAVVLLGEDVWRTHFAAARDIVGRVIRVNDAPCTIVGVLPQNFLLPEDVGDQLWMPLRAGMTHSFTDIIARLRPEATIASASREVERVTASVERLHSIGGLQWRATVRPAASNMDTVVRADGLRFALLVLFAAVGVVLLIACANIANLMLARTAARQRELAVRLALGAGRARLLRLVITESALLAVLGGALGVAVGWRGLQLVIALRPQNLGELGGVHLDMAAIWWSIAISLLSAVLFGIAPALFASGRDPAATLKSETRVTRGNSSRRFRSALVIAEMALSVVLLVAAGLFARSIMTQEHVDPGVDTRGLDVVRFGMSGDRVKSAADRAAAEDALLGIVRALPSVSGASIALGPPPASVPEVGGRISVNGHELGVGEPMPKFGINFVDTAYFRTVGLSLRGGRIFTPASRDTNPLLPCEVIVSETYARTILPRGRALGTVIRGLPDGPVMTVVGIVGDERLAGRANMDGHAQLYLPLRYGESMVSLVLRSPAPIGRVAQAITRAVDARNLPIRIREVTTVDAFIARLIAPSRFVAVLFGCFAVLAFIMAAIGLYGVIAYSVGQRRHELGVRLALGASAHDVVRLVVRDGIRLAGAGAVLGVGVAALAVRTLRSMLFGVGPGDAATYVCTVALLLGTATAASYLPARRAASDDPLHTIGSD